MGQVVFDINRIRETIPHRYPMLLVDRILELEPGNRVVGLKNVTINEAFFQGHFPHRPIMPGVLILESMAQVGAVLLADGRDLAGKVPVFASMEHVRFHKPVLPGDQLVTEVTLLKMRGSIGRVRAVARVEGKVATEAEYTFALVSQEQLDGTAKERA